VNRQGAPQDAYVVLQRTADALARQVEEVLKPRGVSKTQYNALRILRGALPEELSCGEVAVRMFTRDPDITRLFDRLEKMGLAERTRDTPDRRVVLVRITRKGLDLLEMLDEPVRQLHRRQFAELGEQKRKELVRLLESLSS
jgi:DNA-binding MarR family transcriptional regulator